MVRTFRIFLTLTFGYSMQGFAGRTEYGIDRKNVLSTNLLAIPSIQFEHFIKPQFSFSFGGSYLPYYRRSIMGNIDLRWHFYDDQYDDNENDVDAFMGIFTKYSHLEAYSIVSGLDGSQVDKLGSGILFGAQATNLNGFVWGGLVGVGFSYLNYEYGQPVSYRSVDSPFVARAAIWIGYAF